jgi:hypothetical protein
VGSSGPRAKRYGLREDTDQLSEAPEARRAPAFDHPGMTTPDFAIEEQVRRGTLPAPGGEGLVTVEAMTAAGPGGSRDDPTE